MDGLWLTLAVFVITLAALLLNFHSFAFVRDPPWHVRSDPPSAAARALMAGPASR